MKLTLEEYQKAGEDFLPKYWYIAKELGEGAKAEEVLKVMESLAAVAWKNKVKSGVGPFGFNKKQEEEMESAVEAWNTMTYFEGFFFTLWIVGLYIGKLKIDQKFARKTVYRVKIEDDGI